MADKGKVPPGAYRAYGYEPPGHRWADVKLDVAGRCGCASATRRAGSSPAAQQELGLNRDATLHPARGEGEKLRRDSSDS